jgi:hypothetical protein
MKKHAFFRAATALLLAGTLFAACEKTPIKENTPEVETVTVFDDLDFFQRAFVDVKVATETTEAHEAGEIIAISYSMGEPFDENDPTNIFIGVKNLEEALECWDACLAPDISRTSSSANDYTYTFTDKEGKSQGTVNFKAGVDGNVAVITPNLPDLKYFTKVTFILNSAWEAHNGPSDEPRNHVGDVRDFKVPELGTTPFVCIRERSYGVKPIYVAITKDKYEAGEYKNDVINSKWCPGEARSRDIYTLVHNDWDFYVAVFDDAGGGKLDEDNACWIDKDDTYTPAPIRFQYGINLTADKVDHAIDRWDTYWRTPEKRLLLKVDWIDDDALFYVPGENSGGYDEEGAENIFDGQKGTKWCAGRGRQTEESVAFSGKKCWFVEFNTLEHSNPTGYDITTADSAKNRSGRNPKEWALLGKKSSSDAWIVLDKRTNGGLPAENSKTTSFKFNTTTDVQNFKYFRLEITDIAGGTNNQCMQFSDFIFTY